MRILLRYLLLSIGFLVCADAEYRIWKRADGTEAELQLEAKSGEGDKMKATFRLKNGKLVIFPVSQLSEADAKAVRDWNGDFRGQGESIYYDFLRDNLVKLKGDSFESYRIRKEPSKYYLFYYTAGWCGPCQRFTPSLVEFYTKYSHKSGDFEIVLISADRDEAGMIKYAKDKKMTWPHLKLSKSSSFNKEFNQPRGGIPNLVLTDMDGKVLKSSYEGNNYIGPTAVMLHLEELLK